MDKFETILNNIKQVLTNAYVQLHKPNRTSQQIAYYSSLIKDCQMRIQFNMMRIAFYRANPSLL